MLTGSYFFVAAVAASLFGVGAWLATAGHSVRVQRVALVGAALAATALLAPTPWALLPLGAAGAALYRPLVATHLVAAGATGVAFAGLLFLPSADAISRRATQGYATGMKDRAYISGLKSDLRNVATMLEAEFAEHGRYDAVLLAPRLQLYLLPGNELVLGVTADRWRAWAHHTISDKACDHGLDQLPTCPVTLPVDSATSTPPRVFAPEWVRDSLPADHWSRKLQALRPREFGTDSVLNAEEVKTTVTDSGWLAERELAGWHCVTGARKLAPTGVEPGGFVCHILTVMWGGVADPHAH